MLPSALVGAVTWTAVAERLQESAEEVVVADPAGRRTPEDVLEAYVAAAPSPATDLVVVPHSNAGLFAPAVVAAAVPPAARRRKRRARKGLRKTPSPQPLSRKGRGAWCEGGNSLRL